MLKREPTTPKTVAPSSMNVTDRPFIPGFSGRRYGVCDDNRWHLILKVHEDGMTDVLCSDYVHVVMPQPPSEGDTFPMCKECTILHFDAAKWQAA